MNNIEQKTAEIMARAQKEVETAQKECSIRHEAGSGILGNFGAM